MGGFPHEKRLLELLGEAAGLAEQVAGMAEEQSAMLAADDLDGFNKSLDEGQGIINRINGLHQESEALMQSYASFAISADGGKIETIDAATARFVEILERCAALNNRNLAEAKEKTEEFIRQIGSLSLKRKSIGSYAMNIGNDSAFIDKKT